MPKRQKNIQHVKNVVEMPCCLRQYGGCEYGVQAHHLLKPMFGTRGMSMRSDDSNVIPLCYKHHSQLHRTGNESKFNSENLIILNRSVPDIQDTTRFYWNLGTFG